MIRKPLPTVSVIVHRSRILDQHHAYVRIDGADVGYRDLRTGIVHCPGLTHAEHARVVAEATAPLFSGTPSRSATADVYRAILRAAA